MTLKWLSSYAPVDEEFDKVSLLLHGDGTNGSTTIVDSSSSPKAVTAVGDAQISTAQSKFGGSSLVFDGNGDYLTISASESLNFGTQDFTVELWHRFNDTSLDRGFLGSTTNGNLDIAWRTTTGLNVGRINVAWDASFAWSPSINVWYHIAISRSGSNLRAFINGSQIGATATSTQNYNASACLIGASNDFFGRVSDGYINDFRITKGVARYTANFTPPTAPFPDLSPSGRVTIEDNSLDVDARQYIINVEEQDGQPLESGVRTAINDFVVGCKADGIWNAIKASCILAGARTLDGALVPLIGGSPTNNNFVGADYDRETGLVGDGSTKYLLSNLAYNAISSNNEHLSLYRSTALSQNSNGIGGGTTSPISISRIAYVSGTNRYELQDNAAATYGTISYTGFVGISRHLPTDFVYRDNGSSVGVARNSQVRANTSTPYGIFCANYSDLGVVSLADARLAFYSIGESLDLAKLDTRVSNLITAIGAAIP